MPVCEIDANCFLPGKVVYNNCMKKRTWFAIILIGLSGQIAWTIENMYFNVFMYKTITTDPSFIAVMVSSSAVVATLTTILMGALSDRTGKRKIFITVGYTAWALSVLAFAFVRPSLFPSASAAALHVVLLDCIMTFFGSTANDAAFNAYVTETVDSKDRTRVESVVQVLPMAALLIVLGLMDGLTRKNDWSSFFTVTAAIILVSAIASFFLIGKDRGKPVREGRLLDDIISGFRPSTVRGNSRLYTALTAYTLNCLAMQIFFPYIIIYMQTYLGFTSGYAILMALAVTASSAFCIMAGKLVDVIGRLKSSCPSILLMTIGLVILYFARSFALTAVGAIIMMCGYLLTTSILSSLIRDYTPKGSEGQIQGIRMLSQVLIPMAAGPFMGALAFRGSGMTYTDLGVTKTVPTPLIFLLAAAVEILAVIPVLILMGKKEK